MGKNRRNTHTKLLCRANLYNAFKDTDSILEIHRYLSNSVNTTDVDFRITSLEVGRCRGILKRNRRSDGPFKCTHGVALNLFAETLAGLAVFTRLGAHGKGILLKSETEFIKKGKGSDCLGYNLFVRDCWRLRCVWPGWKGSCFGTSNMWSHNERPSGWYCGEGIARYYFYWFELCELTASLYWPLKLKAWKCIICERKRKSKMVVQKPYTLQNWICRNYDWRYSKKIIAEMYNRY